MRAETEFERIVRQADWYASVDASSGLAHHLKAYWPEIKAEITKLRAEKEDLLNAAEHFRAERDAAVREAIERCAKEADRLDKLNFEMPPRVVAGYIRALPDTPAVIATEGES